MSWVNLGDLVRENIAEAGVALEVGGAIRLGNAKYISGKSADNTTNINLLGVNSSNNCLVGYGNYSNSLGGTYVYGNANVGIRSKGDFNITSPTAGLTQRQYGVNKIISTPGMWMQSTQTATLSEAISAQPHGVILAWSYYSDGAKNYEWSYHFVPKTHVANHAGTGMYCIVGDTYDKYLYVYDTKIVGYGTSSGINSSSNGSYVLRYVIGV